MPEGNPAGYIPAWTDWLKKPENLMTGIVLLAGLAQPRREGQNVAGQIGERALGALAFRGGLDQGMRKQSMQERELASQEQYTQSRIQQGAQGLDLQREGLRQQERLAGQARPLTPEEAEAQRAGAQESRSRASLYDRTDPNIRAGGDGADPDKQFRALQRQQAMEAIIAQHTDPLTGKVNIDPGTLASEMVKWDNAMMWAEGLRQSGHMPEIVKDAKGNWGVRVLGSGAQPSPEPNAPSMPGPTEPVVTIQEPAPTPSTRPPLGPIGKAITQGDASLRAMSDAQLTQKLKSADRGTASQIRIEMQRRAKEKKNAGQPK